MIIENSLLHFVELWDEKMKKHEEIEKSCLHLAEKRRGKQNSLTIFLVFEIRKKLIYIQIITGHVTFKSCHNFLKSY